MILEADPVAIRLSDEFERRAAIVTMIYQQYPPERVLNSVGDVELPIRQSLAFTLSEVVERRYYYNIKS